MQVYTSIRSTIEFAANHVQTQLDDQCSPSAKVVQKAIPCQMDRTTATRHLHFQTRSRLQCASHFGVAFLCVLLVLSQRKPDKAPTASHFLAYDRAIDDDYGMNQEEFDEQFEWEDEYDDEFYEEDEPEIFVRNADPNQPLLQSVDHALSDDQFDVLQQCLRDHPMRTQNVNSEETFNGTRGFILSFTESGIANMESSEWFGCLKDYYRKYRLPHTNAWVLNMVWADIPDYEKKFTIDLHTDDALVLNYTGGYRVMPVQTNVLYVFVPERMEGGQLEAWHYDASDDDYRNGAQGRVSPSENRMAFFRGDAQHQVRSYRAPMEDKLRASLVLEQYNVPDLYMQFVEEWHWRDREMGTEMM